MPTCVYCSKPCRPPRLLNGDPDPEPACTTHRRWLARGWIPYSDPPKRGRYAQPKPPCFGCSKPSHVRGYCLSCYRRVLRTGSAAPLPIGRPPNPKTDCACGKPAATKGHCRTCYQRLLRTGSAAPSVKPPKPPCSCCGQPSLWTGLCRTCYKRKERTGSPTPPPPKPSGPCTCCSLRPIYAKGLCNPCYQRARIHGTATPPPPRPPAPVPAGAPCGFCSESVAVSLGLCSKCYQRNRLHGSPERLRQPGGGRPKLFCEKVGQPAQPVVNSVPS